MLRKSAALLVSTSKNAAKLSSRNATVSKKFQNLWAARTHSFSSSQDAEDIKFEIKKDGKRLRASEFSEQVSLLSPNDDKSFVPRAAFDVLLKEYDDVADELLDFKDKYQRSLAETENVRRRGVKQVDDAKLFAIQGFCKDLLEVADVLELAVNAVKQEDLEKGGKAFRDLVDGVSMTRSVLMKTFNKHGLVIINPVNEKFDPNLHEAIFQIPQERAKQQPGYIEVVTKVGFSLKERPIRAAQVGVVAP